MSENVKKYLFLLSFNCTTDTFETFQCKEFTTENLKEMKEQMKLQTTERHITVPETKEIDIISTVLSSRNYYPLFLELKTDDEDNFLMLLYLETPSEAVAPANVHAIAALKRNSKKTELFLDFQKNKKDCEETLKELAVPVEGSIVKQTDGFLWNEYSVTECGPFGLDTLDAVYSDLVFL